MWNDVQNKWDATTHNTIVERIYYCTLCVGLNWPPNIETQQLLRKLSNTYTRRVDLFFVLSRAGRRQEAAVKGIIPLLLRNEENNANSTAPEQATKPARPATPKIWLCVHSHDYHNGSRKTSKVSSRTHYHFFGLTARVDSSYLSMQHAELNSKY